jgi:hypothetical protein
MTRQGKPKLLKGLQIYTTVVPSYTIEPFSA